MAFRKFRIHGAYKKKSDAKKKENSSVCDGRCFIIKRKTKRGIRHLVLQRK